MTHYEILGIRKTASSDEIKTAYKKLVKKYHPDVYVGDKTFAEKKIKEINEAYDILSNPDLKQEYDEKINPQNTGYSPNNFSSYSYSAPNYNTSAYSYKTTTSKRNAQARDSKYSYENYKRTYNTTNTSSYDYQKRYTDYHRSKTPNSNYTANDTTNKYSEKIVDTFFNSNTISKSITLFLIIVCFIIFFIINIVQITSLFGDLSSSLSSTSNNNSSYSNYNSNIDEKDDDYYDYDDSTNYNNTTQTINPYLEPEEKNEDSFIEDFDINDFFTDDEIMDAYLSYGSDAYTSFEEFKQALSEAFYQAYVLHY